MKPLTYRFRTVAEMQAIPLDKLATFCEDLCLWLSVHRAAEREGFAMTTPADAFDWIDDGKHDVKINVRIESPIVPQPKPKAAKKASKGRK